MTPELFIIVEHARLAHREGKSDAVRTAANAFVDIVLRVHDLEFSAADMRVIGGLDHFAGTFPHVRLNLSSQCTLCTPGRKREPRSS
jgi:hypothetical protein